MTCAEREKLAPWPKPSARGARHPFGATRARKRRGRLFDGWRPMIAPVGLRLHIGATSASRSATRGAGFSRSGRWPASAVPGRTRAARRRPRGPRHHHLNGPRPRSAAARVRAFDSQARPARARPEKAASRPKGIHGRKPYRGASTPPNPRHSRSAREKARTDPVNPSTCRRLLGLHGQPATPGPTNRLRPDGGILMEDAGVLFESAARPANEWKRLRPSRPARGGGGLHRPAGRGFKATGNHSPAEIPARAPGDERPGRFARATASLQRKRTSRSTPCTCAGGRPQDIAVHAYRRGGRCHVVARATGRPAETRACARTRGV